MKKSIRKSQKLDGLMPVLLNTAQVCKILNMSRQGVAYHRLKGTLPYHSFGYKTKRYNYEDFMAWMAKREMNKDA